ncbi:MAG: hypothetical protein ISS82_01230 [Nanoarchaeota archaeon]|nr:hypothetical protein [Nanoarchaeota archaeon]
MSNIELLSENPKTMVEITDLLDKTKKRDKELTPRGVKTQNYISKFTKLNLKQVITLRENINKLGISRLKEKNINKIIDIQPKDIDSIKSILGSENITLKQEDLTKILEIMK